MLNTPHVASATAPAPGAKTPHDVDLHVGRRIRARRKALGVTQEQLADSLGLTFQQVQKYERGANRVSASKLFQIAEALETPINHFFAGLDQGGHAEPDTAVTDQLLCTPHGRDLAVLFIQLPAGRRAVLLTLAGQLLVGPSVGEA
jgi:transcriptional regulator with XRE-family HTH domain